MNSEAYWQIVAAVITGDVIFMFLLMGIATFFPSSKKKMTLPPTKVNRVTNNTCNAIFMLNFTCGKGKSQWLYVKDVMAVVTAVI